MIKAYNINRKVVKDIDKFKYKKENKEKGKTLLILV